MFGDDGTPRGIGNQVSVEFNLLYRFHSAISKRDDKWTTEFFEGIFPDHKGRLDQLTPMELYIGLSEYEKKLPRDPSQRTFGDLKRGSDGKFKDEDLARTLQEGIEDPAGKDLGPLPQSFSSPTQALSEQGKCPRFCDVSKSSVYSKLASGKYCFTSTFYMRCSDLRQASCISQ